MYNIALTEILFVPTCPYLFKSSKEKSLLMNDFKGIFVFIYSNFNCLLLTDISGSNVLTFTDKFLIFNKIFTSFRLRSIFLLIL